MRLIELREKHGLSRKETALKVGVSEVAIWQYENGNYKPKYDVAKKLAELFGCTVDEIMAGFDE